MANNTPLVTVIMTTYNHEKYVGDAIESVLNQTFDDIELVIVNDGSCDNTEKVIKEFTDGRIVSIYQENQGPSVAANNAILASRGKYIAIMSGDDLSHPLRIEKQLSEYQKQNNKRVLFSHCNFIDDDNNSLNGGHFAKEFFNCANKNRFEILNHYFWKGNYLNDITTFTEKETFLDVGLYNPLFLQLQDFDLWMRTLLKGYEFYIMPEKLISYRIRANNANLSAPSAESVIRTTFEKGLILRNYLQIKTQDDLLNIFPEIKKFNDGIEPDLIPFYIAQLSISVSKPCHQLFGIETLFNLLNDPVFAIRLKEKVGFEYSDFFKITGQQDIFRLFHNLFSKLYVNTGNNYSEQEVVIQRANLALSNFTLSFDLSKYSNIQSLRWDPMENNWCKVTIEEMYYFDKTGNKHNLDKHLLTSNGIPPNGGNIVFRTFDPMVFIPLRGNVNSFFVSGTWEIIGFDKIEQYINNTYSKEDVELIKALEERLNSIYNSQGWKVLACYYKIKGIIFPVNTKRYVVAKNVFNTILKSKGYFKKINKKNFKKCLFLLHGKGCQKLRKPDALTDNYLLYLDSTATLPEIDIIIVTYDSGMIIQGCIESLESSDYPKEKIRIVVLDNNSTDQTLGVLDTCESFYKNITVLKNKNNVGFGSGVNLASKYARGKYLFILNPDTMVDRNCLRNLACAAMLTEDKGFAAWEARQQPFEHPKIYDPVTLETEWMSGACFLIDREIFEKVNKFDIHIFLYCEDVDLSWRIRMFGKKLMYVPRSIVIHDTYKNPDVVKPTQFYYSILSNGILRHKFGSIQDIILFYFQFLGVFLYPPQLEKVRSNLISIGFSHIPRLINSLVWRIKNRKQLASFSPTFLDWDFSIRKKGAFYTLKKILKKPLISIVIRTKERPDFLREALQSIRNQTYQNIEVIVVEDRGETSRSVIDKFQDLKIKYFTIGKPGGRCKAGNLGLSQASGKYVNFLDDDDLFYSDHVEVLVGELENTKSCLAAYTVGFEVKTEIIKEVPLIYKEIDYTIVHARKHDRNDLLISNYIPINCMMFSREIFLKEGGFDEALDILEDWDLWIRYSKHTDFLFIEKTTCLYRIPSSLLLSIKRMEIFDAAYKNVRAKHV